MSTKQERPAVRSGGLLVFCARTDGAPEVMEAAAAQILKGHPIKYIVDDDGSEGLRPWLQYSQNMTWVSLPLHR